MLFGLAAAIACGSSAGDTLDDMMNVPDAEAQSSGSGVKLLGYTSFAMRLDAGVFRIYEACQAEFGPETRICSSLLAPLPQAERRIARY
jgi:hypothetical protein